MDKISQHLAKARSKLESARILHKSRKYDDAVSRAYYSMFHAAKAVLELSGIETRTHAGLIKEFGLEFVNRGYVDKVLGRALATAQEDRAYADYGIDVEITREDSEAVIRDAEKFVEAIEKLARKLEK